MVRSSTKIMTPVDATRETFASHLADQPGKDISVTREDVEIAKALTAEDLARLPADISRGELLRIARVKDPEKRKKVIEMKCYGMEITEAIEWLGDKTGAARLKARLADAKLSDAEWIATHCGEFRKFLQDPSTFDRDAALFRHNAAAKAIYLRDGEGKAAAELRKTGHHPLAMAMLKHLFMPRPGEWDQCFECFGQNVDNPNCTRCRGAGYTIPILPDIPMQLR